MADVTIESAAHASNWKAASRSQVFISATVGYQFYVDTSTDLIYKKTTNGGTSWGAKVTVKAGTIGVFDIWYERWTPGDTGTKILIAYTDSVAHDLFFRTLDTAASDALSTEVQVFNGVSFTAITGTWLTRWVSITKGRGGYLYIACNPDSYAEADFYRSTDGGSTWSDLTLSSGAAWTTLDRAAQLVPGTATDPHDIWAVLHRMTTSLASTLSVTRWDHSEAGWTSATSLDGDTNLTSLEYLQFNTAVRHSDGHTIVAWWADADTATGTLHVYDLTLGDTVGASLQTPVIENTAEYAQCAVFVDQNTDDIYVAYLGGSTWLTNAHVYYKKSTDGGATWGVQTQINETLDDSRAVWCDHGGTDTRFIPAWQNIDLDDLYVNAGTSVAITPPSEVVGTLVVTLDPVTLAAAGSAPSTGTVAVALDPVTLAAQGAVESPPATGTAAVLLGDVVVAGAGSAPSSGAAALTLDETVLVAQGSAPATGATTLTLEDLTLAAQGTVAVSGVAVLALDDTSLVATGSVGASGTAAFTFDDVTLAAQGSAPGLGTAALVLDDVALVAQGSVSSPTGTAEIQLGDVTLLAEGVLGAAPVVGTASIALDATTLAAQGSAPASGASDLLLDDITLEAQGSVLVSGAASLSLDDTALEAHGSAPVAGAAVVLLDDVTLVAQGTGLVSGTAALLLDEVTLLAEGIVGAAPATGTAALVLGDTILEAHGSALVSGTASLTLDDTALVAQGSAEVAGAAAIELENVSLSAQGLVTQVEIVIPEGILVPIYLGASALHGTLQLPGILCLAAVGEPMVAPTIEVDLGGILVEVHVGILNIGGHVVTDPSDVILSEAPVWGTIEAMSGGGRAPWDPIVSTPSNHLVVSRRR